MGPCAVKSGERLRPRPNGKPKTNRSEGPGARNLGFDPSAWDPLFPIAARIEERIHRAVCFRLTEVLDLLRQVAGSSLQPLPREDVEALAFCLVDEYVSRSLESDLPKDQLLQRVACCSLDENSGKAGSNRSYWFRLNLTLRRFRQWRATAGLEEAVRRALRECSPALEQNPRISQELAKEFARLVADAGPVPRTGAEPGVSRNHVTP